MKSLDDQKRTGMFFSLRSRMLLHFGALFVIVLSIWVLVDLYGIPFLPFEGRRGQHQSEIFQSLNLVADLKKELLLRWIEERRDDAKVISESDLIKVRVSEIRDTIKGMKRGLKGNELWEALRHERVYRELKQHLNLVKDAYGMYERIQIADAKTGLVIASTESADLGWNVSLEDFFTFPIFHNDLYVNTEKHRTDSRIHLHISQPVKAIESLEFEEKEISAVLTMMVQSDDMIDPMLHTGGGLGETGEVVLINQDVTILTFLKYPLADGTIAEPLEYQIKAQAAVLAARGEEGIITTEDYRGVPVLAAYRHLPITPELGWGMVVKQDEAEVFSPMRKSMFYSFAIGLAGVLIVLGFTYIISTNLSRPIQILSQTARQVRDGNLAVRAPTDLTHEAGTLAITFNSMVQRIQKWRDELEQQVHARTVELTRVNEARERLTRRLLETNKELEQIVYISSHDLRTPLVNIHGFAKELDNALKNVSLALSSEDVPAAVGKRLSPTLNEDIPEYLHYIFTSTAKMDSLISGLLRISRLGKVELTIQELNMNKLISEVLMAFKFQVQEAEATVNIEKLPMCMGDETGINQVFSNLLDNALKYLDSDRAGIITISGRRRAGNSIYCIEDNGVGISEDHQAKIFDIFYRVDRNSGNGDGLGLTIVRKIVDRHYGKTWVESKPGEGSKFFVSLPFHGWEA